ncbi:MAG: transcription-repair coupling factor [Candidatus Margulisiibacteriota bacterium]
MILSKLIQPVQDREDTQKIIAALKLAGAPVAVGGVVGGRESLLFAALQCHFKNFSLIITPSILSAERKYQDLLNFLPEADIELLPRLDSLPFESTSPSLDLQGKRITSLHKILTGQVKVLVAPIKALIFKLPAKKFIQNNIINFTCGERVNLDELSHKLIGMGYTRVNLVGERGEFAVRGGIVDIFTSDQENPCRVELDDDQIVSLRAVDPLSQRSISKIDSARVLPAKELSPEATLADYLPKDARVMLSEKVEVARVIDELIQEVYAAEKFDQKNYAQQLAFADFDAMAQQFGSCPQLLCSPFLAPADLTFLSDGQVNNYSHFASFREELTKALARRQEKKTPTIIISKHAVSLREIFNEENVAAEIIDGQLTSGFNLDDLNTWVLSDYEIFGEKGSGVTHEKQSIEGIDQIHTLNLDPGDYVVHENYGIGKYLGMEILEDIGSKQEYLAIEYAGEDQLHVPITAMGLITKYSSGSDLHPKLDHLGSKQWLNTKGRAKKKIREMTKELLALYAERSARPGFAYAPDDIWQKELATSFEYEETPDQKKAIIEIKQDMETARPMDRLLCGDVGYGKTEVAIRAAVKAVSSGKQVAVLVPTTVLAKQHFLTFSERLKSFPIKIEMLSRFKDKGEQKQIVEEMKLGRIDIIIGTHRLLSKDVAFADLGLLVIDEEHRFGVAHKEKIKMLKLSVDVLTLTATPIPRTLHMSLAGTRDLSLINTPPLDRSPVRTYVLDWNEAVVKEAILREVERGGQIYFVHNFVHSIDAMAAQLKKLVPGIKIVVAHGQMSSSLLEKNVLDFYQKKYDLLLCSAIIESGLDMPNVNTIIIDQADRLGLAQLYQLRGRVGRSSVRAYAYLLSRKGAGLTEDAIKRLLAIQEFTRLGSGYKLAMRDLEIRGAGNILGAEQSGHLAAVGFDMYCELVAEAVAELRGKVEIAPRQVVLDIKTDAFIPADYVQEESERIALYRRMNLLEETIAIEQMKEELGDRYGKLPKSVKTLLKLLELKVLARGAGVVSIRGEARQVAVEFAEIPDKKIIQKAAAVFKNRIKFVRHKLLLDVRGLSADEWSLQLQRVFITTA